jgi:(1->4)-alpha-D-glucan 1-alpha-D-glucosylmutase
MLASTTHDTKRSEDVRARLLVLAEIPDRFVEAVERWRALNERHWTIEPDRNLEWLLYQTLVGAHPLSNERALRYVEKAMREAKVHTSWTEPNAPYEDGIRTFVERALLDDPFVSDLAAFVEPLVEPGRSNSLAMQAIKLTSPGVPDIYQGTELWDLSLVDPDNRRPVDYDERRRLLASGEHPKLLLTQRLLHLGVGGDCTPLAARGEASEHVLAFVRGSRHATVVTRFPLRLAERGGFGDTTITLPSGHWTCALSGASVRGGEVPVEQVLGSVAATVLEAG